VRLIFGFANQNRDQVLDIPLGTEWILHQGPAVPQFDQAAISGRERDREGAGESAQQGSDGPGRSAFCYRNIDAGTVAARQLQTS
jgi:hypothetical protein